MHSFVSPRIVTALRAALAGFIVLGTAALFTGSAIAPWPVLAQASPNATSAGTGKAKKATSAKKTSSAKANGAASQDTGTVVKRPVGALGPQSGDRHLAYKGAGSDLDSLWPPKIPAPLPGSILPAKRVIAFYGNPRSTRMGILGEFAPDEMLRKLDREVAEWNRLDPQHPVQPALHLIAVVAAGDKGFDGKYRNRMDSTLIEQVYGWAKSRNAIMFIDVQVGLSTLQQELPLLERFLKRPDVHLGIDPEFSMKDGSRPGKKIGTYDAADVNYASRFLAELVDKYKLPPKMLVIHRFTRKGVTNADKIRLDPKVQIVMHMDGFGAPWLKRDSFYSYIKKEPVQFAGWKQFTKAKNDKPTTPREEILRLWPQPLYIQIQ
ncbi:hypothetical protein [Gemmatimonas phototrophica]|uniref:hypothetical protein n=1 Tax=Gemmatimonas phototrophica TaxID=1379270 RepID=UPI000ADAD65F|nr:hypothetical protein [Gemmatimonas phototrophica]